MRKNAKKVLNFSLFLQFTDIYRNFWISKFFFVFTLNFRNTVNLRFLRIFFEFTVILFRTAINLRWPKVNFTTVNLPRKIRKKGVNRKTGGKVRCLLSGSPFLGRLLALHTNLRQDWKGLPGTNTAAAFEENSFTLHWRRTIKLFTTVITASL